MVRPAARCRAFLRGYGEATCTALPAHQPCISHAEPEEGWDLLCTSTRYAMRQSREKVRCVSQELGKPPKAHAIANSSCWNGYSLCFRMVSSSKKDATSAANPTEHTAAPTAATRRGTQRSCRAGCRTAASSLARLSLPRAGGEALRPASVALEPLRLSPLKAVQPLKACKALRRPTMRPLRP